MRVNNGESLNDITDVYVEKVGLDNDPMYYWKLFVDFETINEAC